jgi:hypothetical protein
MLTDPETAPEGIQVSHAVPDHDGTDLNAQHPQLRQQDLPPGPDMRDVVGKENEGKIKPLDGRDEVGSREEVGRASADRGKHEVHGRQETDERDAVGARKVTDQDAAGVIIAQGNQAGCIIHRHAARLDGPAPGVPVPEVHESNGTLLRVIVQQKDIKAGREGPLREVERDGGLARAALHGTHR